MARKTPAAKKGRTISVDMTNVEAGSRIDDGEYRFTVDEASIETSESDNEYVKFKFKTDDNKVCYHNCSLQPQALWNLRNTLEALALEVPASSMEIDLDDLIGRSLMGIIENETYQGKKRPRITDVFPEDGGAEAEPEGEAEEEEEEEEAAIETEGEGDELDELDRTGLKKLLLAESIEFKVMKSTEDDAIRTAIREARASAAGGGEEEEEEEEEAQPAATTKKKAGSKFLPVGTAVTFDDEGKTLKGKIEKVNEKEGFYEVSVGKERWEIEVADVQKA